MMEYYPAVKKVKYYYLQWHGWILIERIMPSKISQMEKAKNDMISLICEIYHKK